MSLDGIAFEQKVLPEHDSILDVEGQAVKMAPLRVVIDGSFLDFVSLCRCELPECMCHSSMINEFAQVDHVVTAYVSS